MSRADCGACDGDGIVFVGTGSATDAVVCPACCAEHFGSVDDHREEIARLVRAHHSPRSLCRVEACPSCELRDRGEA